MRFTRFAAFLTLCGAVLFLWGCDSAGTSQSNQSPSADVAVSSSTVDVGSQVTLDGSGSSDPDGDDLSYSWSLNGPSGSSASLSDPNSETATFTPDVAGDYTATLEVSDGNATDSDNGTLTAESVTVEISSDITSDRTLSPDNSYLVTSSICVENSSTLTIEAGVLMKFESGTSLKVCGDGSALVAQGTSSDGITMTGTTEQAGFWNGIGMKSANTNNELSYVTIEYAGGNNIYTYSSAGAVQLRDGSKISISNSIFRNNSGYGVSADRGNVTFSSFSSNTFENNGTASMNLHASDLGVPDASSSYGSYVYIWGGRVDDQTLTVSDIGVPYRISGVQEIENGSDVTLEAGVTFEFESTAGLRINGDATAFKAQGVEGDSIAFRGATQQAGFWNGIGMTSANTNNELSHVTVEHAGNTNLYTYSSAGAIQLRDGAKVAITNSTFRNNKGYGVSSDRGNVTFSSFSSNTFENNGTASMNLHASDLGVPDASSSYGSHVYIWGGRVDDQTLTVSDIGVPYRISGVREIENGSDVTLEAGVTFEFESAAGLRINGDATAFQAAGTDSAPVTFTGTTENKGFWKGIGIGSSNPNNEMTNVTVEYGGGTNLYVYSEAANIQVRNGQLTITESLIQYSASYGLSKTGNSASVSETNNTYENNSSGPRNF